MDYGTLPQWMTAGVAVAAGLIAIWNIKSQRELARKRAAFDVFLKTETDEKMLTAYDNFHTGIIEMKKVTSIDEFCTSELTRPHYLSIRKYLNVHELVAVGIRENVLDSNVCYSYWADALTNGYSVIQQHPSFNFEAASDACNVIDGDIAFGPLDPAEIGAVYATLVSQRLLTETTLGSKATHIPRQDVSKRSFVGLFHKADFGSRL
jgi:hypothetical protein